MIFSKLYQVVLNWANHQYAAYYLAFLSFIEAIFLPFPPPDVLLAPITLQHKHRAYQLAFLTTIFSVLGGVVGYFLGYFIYEIILPWLTYLDYTHKIALLKSWFDRYGIWVIALAGFSPVPYKLFTITAGFLSMALLPFVVISLLARGTRFYLVAFLVKKIGDSCDHWLKQYIDYLGYGLVLLFLMIYLI